MSYTLGYVVFGALFLAGVVGYWVVTRPFRDPKHGHVAAGSAERGPAV